MYFLDTRYYFLVVNHATRIGIDFVYFKNETAECLAGFHSFVRFVLAI